MSFMQKQVYFGGYFSIDTNIGTEIVPADVIQGAIDGITQPGALFSVELFYDYLEGKPEDEEELVEYKQGWLGRMSAPGYLDCTDWSVYSSEEEANEELDNMYGDDNED